jgi:hypothetical protein
MVGGIILSIDKDKFDVIQVIVPKEITPKLADRAKANRRKISPYILELIIKDIEEHEQNKK